MLSLLRSSRIQSYGIGGGFEGQGSDSGLEVGKELTLHYALVPHIGLRLQYRGNLNNAPDVSTLFTSSKAFMHTAQPMGGVYFRF